MPGLTRGIWGHAPQEKILKCVNTKIQLLAMLTVFFVYFPDSTNISFEKIVFSKFEKGEVKYVIVISIFV